MEWTNETPLQWDAEEYDVYDNDTGEYLGSIEMKADAKADDMPDSLEINGVEYIAKK